MYRGFQTHFLSEYSIQINNKNHLKPLKCVLPDVILPNQIAFVKDRLLLENVLLASEVLNGYHSKKSSPRIALKIDISKTFESVRWDFILIALISQPILSLQSRHASLPHRSLYLSMGLQLDILKVVQGFDKGTLFLWSCLCW